MKFRNTSYKYLLIALFCFAGAAVLNIYVNFIHPGQSNKKVAEISEQIQAAVRKAYRDVNRVKPYLANDTVNFHDLLNDQTYFPTFIFRNGQIVFWTDHTVVTDFSPNFLNHSLRIIENKFGKFLVVDNFYNHYQIQVYIPLERVYGINNKYLSSGLNPDIFKGQEIKIVFEPESTLPQITYQGKYLFSVQTEEDNTITFSHSAMALILVGLISLIWGLIGNSALQLRQGHGLRSVIFLFLPLLIIRVLLLYFNLPYSVWEFEAFNPRLFAASFWSPSIGDLLLNALLLLIFTFHLKRLFRRERPKAFIEGLAVRAPWVSKLVCVGLFYVLLLWLFQIYYTGFSNSLLVMDITQSLQFSVYKGIFYFTFVIHTVVFLVFAYLLMHFFCILEPTRRRTPRIIGLSLLGAIITLVGSLTGQVLVVLFGLTLIFFLTVLFIPFRKNISSNPFQNYLFIFWIIAISALAGSLAMYQDYHQQLLGYKQKFAANLVLERDIEGEYLLEDITRKIQRDRLIKKSITSPFSNKELIQQKILKYYLRDYFDKYESSVKIFNAFGLAADVVGNQYSLSEYRQSYLAKATETEHPGLYLIKDNAQPYSRRYIKLIPLVGYDGSKATIALELDLTKLMPNSVVPELLVDQRNYQPLSSRSFSYAIYQGNALQYNEGPYEYIHAFNLLNNPDLYTSGVRLLGFHHWAYRSGEKRIVISTEQYTVYDVISNFSFLFLIHTGGFLVYILVFLMAGGGLEKALNTNFSTKIQLFLNFGILIPLLVVSVATASLVTASYKRDLQDTYEKRGRLVQENILNSWSWATHESNRDALREEVNSIADLSEADINVYNAQGRIITSSQPLIFEKGLISRLMNPEAFADIKENQAQRILLKEQMGSITYNALYLPLPSVHQNGAINGFIGIPFFDSEKELDSKLIQLLTTIMNIFVLMFLAFMLITNWAARALTVPLKLVTQKLKQTTLTGQNEELVYESADEIGILVSEYNQMLRKLDDNKKELAMREKEAAWREMARQVAHEIKNPLTPMKLSLQYLQKAISEKRDNLEVLINKISGTLITQIEILSDIATSFSNFTSLPDIKPERIDLVSIVKQCLDLHSNPGEVSIERNFEAGTFTVMADENILMRTFNNLIINALQAIPAGRHPEILVSLEKEKENALIRFRDNGSGIPAEVQHKIFVPNFSTKFTGSGIGLAVAKKGIESAGGRIWFETQEGEGTTFYITLPLVQE